MDFGGDKRERILAAASQLIVRNGLQCSMASIAETAGVATGSLYNYFKSKDDLIWGVYGQLSEIIAECLIAEHAPATSHRDRLLRYIHDYIEFIWADHDRAILFEYLSNAPLIPPDQLTHAFGRVTAYTHKVVSEAQDAGLLRDFPVELMGGFIGGGIRNTLKWRRANPARLTDLERNQIAELCLSAVVK